MSVLATGNRAAVARYRARNPQQSQDWRRRNPDKARVISLRSKAKRYGLSLEEYCLMVLRQKGRCAICDAEGDVLCLDHDHSTGKLRALLCHRCNTRLACLEDIEWEAKARAYLNEYREVN